MGEVPFTEIQDVWRPGIGEVVFFSVLRPIQRSGLTGRNLQLQPKYSNGRTLTTTATTPLKPTASGERWCQVRSNVTFPVSPKEIADIGLSYEDAESYVNIPLPRRHNNPHSWPIKGDLHEGEVFSVSVMHQLHCLVSRRQT